MYIVNAAIVIINAKLCLCVCVFFSTFLANSAFTVLLLLSSTFRSFLDFVLIFHTWTHAYCVYFFLHSSFFPIFIVDIVANFNVSIKFFVLDFLVLFSDATYNIYVLWTLCLKLKINDNSLKRENKHEKKMWKEKEWERERRWKAQTLTIKKMRLQPFPYFSH